jgi:glyoxylase-like metal-dependent hydrolase (beta-lactamase superfamily II)
MRVERVPAAVALISALFITPGPAASAPPQEASIDPALPEDSAVKLSAHVHMIEGFPNVAIVVGETATLVVDTGLGPRNGAVVARTATRLGRAPRLYLVTTHFHPEHAGGEAGFPAGTILIRPRIQQEEMDRGFTKVLDRFFSKSFPTWVEGMTFRKPDVLYDTRHDLDLGGVHVRLIWAGPAHTRGDQVMFVEEDRVLISGDVVQNKLGPYFSETGASPRAWAKTVEALVGLHPVLIVPDHSPPGGEELIAAQRDFLVALDERAQALKRAGIPAAEASKTVNEEMAARYPDWRLPDLSAGVEVAYAD